MLRQLMQIKIYLGYIEKKKINITQSASACLDLTIETLEQGVKYIQT